MVSDERDQGARKCHPAATAVVGLLFDPAMRPAFADIEAQVNANRSFALTESALDTGQAELLCDGLTFDCHGLLPGDELRLDSGLQLVALPGDFAVADHALVTLSPGPQLSGAGHLLPVVRILSGLVLALGEIPGVRATAWLPAQLAMSPAWFAQAVGIWLKGGPFPALALTGLIRSERSLASRGLSYFVGQEFSFAGKDGTLREGDMRGAVRLIDWLVAHGRIDRPREIDLIGFGSVLVEPDGPNPLRARSL